MITSISQVEIHRYGGTYRKVRDLNRKRLKKGKVIAIEPGPVISKKNVALNNLTNVILLNIAALDKDGEASLY